MATRKGPQDDKLVRELYEKLNWFTFQATEEEFDPEQVQAILKLLDSMDPLPEESAPGSRGSSVEAADALAASENMEKSSVDVPKAGEASKAHSVDSAVKGEEPVQLNNAAAAFERFKKKYNITEEDLARKNALAAGSGEKVVPFPVEFSEELAFDGRQVRGVMDEKAAEQASKSVEEAAEAIPFVKKAAETFGAAAGEGAAVQAAEAKAVGTVPVEAGGRKKRRFWHSLWGKIAAAFAVVVVGAVGLGIGTSAVQQKPFLEVVREGVNGFKGTVTGNVMKAETSVELVKSEKNIVYYESWDEVADENPDIMIPGYIPDGMELEELYKQEYENYWIYRGMYYNVKKDALYIQVRYYKGNYSNWGLENEEFGEPISVDGENDIRYYRLDNKYAAIWNMEKCVYVFMWNSIDVIDKIICNMK